MEKKVTGKIIYKLFLILFVSICIPLFVFSYVSYVMSYRSIEKDYIDGKNNLDRQVAENVEGNFNVLKNQSIALYDYDSISYILTADKTEINDEYLRNYNLVYGNLVSIIQGNPKLDSISLINQEGEVKFYFDRNMAQQNLHTVAEEEWFSEALELKGRALIVPPHENVFTNKGEQVVSICRAIIDFNDDSVSGILKIDQAVSTFEAIFENVEKDEGEMNLVYDESGQLFYVNGDVEESDARELFDYVNSQEEEKMTWKNEQNWIISCGESSRDGWKIVSLIPKENMYKRAGFIRTINATLTFILAIVCAGVAMVISNVINQPIRKLKESMIEFQSGNMMSRAEIYRNDEFGMIADVYNSMVGSIQKLINEKYELKLLKKQAQLENYQSQINPHFLFNTLNSIKSVAMQEKAETTTKMIQYFSESFRYALNRGVYVVNFGEELEYIDKYISLQMLRFRGRVVIEKEIEEDVYENECIRMTLQPIIENAFLHGIEKTSEQGKILIVAQNVGDEFYIYISNTGAVIPEERMDEINAQLSCDEENNPLVNHDKVGIYNVNARIKYHYGSDYGLTLLRGVENETIVRIYLPKVQKEG